MIEQLKCFRRYRQCSEDVIEVAINSIFHKYGIKREAYHGDQINGVCVMRIMDDYEYIIHKINFIERLQ